MATQQSAPGAGVGNTATSPVSTIPGLNTAQNTAANTVAKSFGVDKMTPEQTTAIQNVQKQFQPVGIVTSDKSKTQYNNDVTTLNNGLTGIKNSFMTNPDGSPIVNPDGSWATTDQNKTKDTTSTDSSNTVSDNNGNQYNIPEGVDPSIANSLINNINTASSDIKSYQDQMNALAKYDVNTDPIASAAAKSIQDSFNVLIDQMKNKNTMLMGSIKANSARNGAMQYTNEMDSMYKNAEFDKGIQRINDLQTKATNAINASNAAYQSGNVKALATATKLYEDSKNEGRQALLDFQKTINDQIKNNQDKAKQDAADIKQQNATDITNSKAVAQMALDQITASGVTDEAQIDAFLQDVADNNGISNPEILKGQISILNPQAGTAALKNKNIISTMNKRTIDEKNAATRLAITQSKNTGNKTVTAFQKDVKTQIDNLNTTTTTGSKKTWGDAYNTLAQNYGDLSYPVNGKYVKIADQLSPDDIKSLGGDPKVDNTILDIALHKKDNQNK